jgi:hypothetical protein
MEGEGAESSDYALDAGHRKTSRPSIAKSVQRRGGRAEPMRLYGDRRSSESGRTTGEEPAVTAT